MLIVIACKHITEMLSLAEAPRARPRVKILWLKLIFSLTAAPIDVYLESFLFYMATFKFQETKLTFFFFSTSLHQQKCSPTCC